MRNKIHSGVLISLFLLFGLISCTAPSPLVKTPKGTEVKEAHKVTRELTPEELAEVNRQFEPWKSKVTLVRNSTLKYNCHSYAWYNQSSSNDIWISSPGDDTYWNDKSYVETTTKSVNNKVSYCADDHSAIVYSSTKFISKWGPGPLVIHSPADVPFALGTSATL